MPRASNLRQSNRRYQVRDQVNLGGESRLGSYVLKRNSGCEYWKPSWNNTKTCIRIFPGLDPEDNSKFDQFRLTTEPLDFGDWIRTYPAVRNFGDPGLTMLLYDPTSEETYNANANPCSILYWAIEKACKDNLPCVEREWYPLREFNQGRGRILSKPAQIGLVQCAMMTHNNKDFFDGQNPPRGGAPEDKTVVFELSISAVKALFDLLESKDDDWEGDPEDFAQYKYGDIVAPEAGGYVWLYQRGTDMSAGTTKREVPKSAFGGKRNTSLSSGDQEVKGFDCSITDDFKGVPAAIEEELLQSKVKPWEDILQFYTNDEQAHLLNGSFPASAIMYAFRDHPEWIDSTTKRISSKTKQVEVRKPVEEDAGDDEETEKPPTRSNSSWGKKAPNKPPATPHPKQDSVVPEDEIPDDELDPPGIQVEEQEEAIVNGAQDEELVDFPPKDEEDFDEQPDKPSEAEAAAEALKVAKNRANSRKRR